MKLTLTAKSSSSDGFYNVDFHHENDKLKVFCNCTAGSLGRFCKHKWQLMSGDAQMLSSDAQIDELNQVLSWVDDSDFKKLYNRVNELEMEIAVIKKQIKAEKKNVERRMREGF
jgi:hypothetical protein